MMERRCFLDAIGCYTVKDTVEDTVEDNELSWAKARG